MSLAGFGPETGEGETMSDKLPAMAPGWDIQRMLTERAEMAALLERLIDWEAFVFAGSGSPVWDDARSLLARIKGEST